MRLALFPAFALVQMGANMSAARECLAATERRSIQYIAKLEFDRFIYANKTAAGNLAETAQAKPERRRKSSRRAAP